MVQSCPKHQFMIFLCSIYSITLLILLYYQSEGIFGRKKIVFQTWILLLDYKLNVKSSTADCFDWHWCNVIMTPSGHEMGCTLSQMFRLQNWHHVLCYSIYTEHCQHVKQFALCNISSISMIHCCHVTSLHCIHFISDVQLSSQWLPGYFKYLIQFWENPDGNKIKRWIKNRIRC